MTGIAGEPQQARLDRLTFFQEQARQLKRRRTTLQFRWKTMSGLGLRKRSVEGVCQLLPGEAQELWPEFCRQNPPP